MGCSTDLRTSAKADFYQEKFILELIAEKDISKKKCLWFLLLFVLVLFFTRKNTNKI